MDTNQIAELFFKFPSGKRKCQARMKSLYDRKLVKKARLSLDTSTIYFQGKFPAQYDHSLALTWCYVWMMKKQGEKVLSWEIEELKEFGLRVDALCSTFITMTKEVRWYCFELTKSASRNDFLKIPKYDALYLKEGIAGSKLMKRLGEAQRFPKVVIVTDSIKHAQKIKSLVSESVTKVRYEVYLLQISQGIGVLI
jgi:hypothetical protein